MPTVLRVGPYRFLFYATDRDEPHHVHVVRDAAQTKFWIQPVRLEWSEGFRPFELNRIEGIIEEHQQELIEAWNDYFND